MSDVILENHPANTVVMAVTYWDLNLLDEAGNASSSPIRTSWTTTSPSPSKTEVSTSRSTPTQWTTMMT